jgi:transposase
MDGVIYADITQGSFDGDSFQEFLARLLPLMNPYPQKNSVLVMDNCAIHHVDGVAQMCAER